LSHRVELAPRFLLVGVISCCAAGPAWADTSPKTLDLAWTAPATCPTEAHVRAEVERYLGRQLDSFANSVTARGVVSNESGDRWRVDLTTTFRGRSRARPIEGDSCTAVADAVALVLAFMIDPQLASPERTSDPPVNSVPATQAATLANPPAPALANPPAPALANPPAPANVDVAPAPPTSATRERIRPWALRLATGADSAALPEPTGFVAFAARRAFGPVSIEGSAAYYFPRTRAIEGSALSRGGTFDLAAVALRGCYALLTGGFELGPCVGTELGTVRGSGFGVGEPGEGNGLWSAATAAAWSRWRVAPWFGAVIEAGVALPLVRPHYVIDNVGLVYRADIIGYRGLAGIESYF
jgi:hypothetical protein